MVMFVSIIPVKRGHVTLVDVHCYTCNGSLVFYYYFFTFHFVYVFSISRLLLTVLVFLPRDASAERGNARVSRPSVRPSVCLSVRL